MTSKFYLWYRQSQTGLCISLFEFCLVEYQNELLTYLACHYPASYLSQLMATLSSKVIMKLFGVIDISNLHRQTHNQPSKGFC